MGQARRELLSRSSRSLAEGFFATGVVLIEGRSDKAALTASAQVLGLNFEAAGIAVLSAEGKENFDRPLVILKELGIPRDCESHKAGEGAKPATNLALLRLAPDENTVNEPATGTTVGATYAHFSETLERTMRHEIGPCLNECLAAACEPVGIAPSNDAQKIPEIMRQKLNAARAAGENCPTRDGSSDLVAPARRRKLQLLKVRREAGHR